MKTSKKRVGFVSITLGIVVGVIYVLASTAGYFDPREHLIMAFFGLAFPVIALAQLGATVFSLLRKKWLLGGVQILILAASWPILSAHFAFRWPQQNTSSKSTLRVMTYNVHFFNTLVGDKNENTLKDIQELIIKEQPDVLCIQEFYFKKKGRFDFKDTLLKQTHFNYAYFEPTMKSESETIGLIIYSKYPIRNRGSILFDSTRKSGNMATYADILVKNKMIRVYNMHLQSLKFKAEDYNFIQQKSDTNDEIKPVKRIARLIKTGFEKRAYQVDLMLQHFASCQTPYIIMGDFNDTPGSYALHKITQNLNNTFTQKGSGWGCTFYAFMAPLQIDYIAHTKDLETQTYHTVTEKFSDHYPVISDVKIQ